MPRKNNRQKQTPQTPFRFIAPEDNKTRYKNKHEAERVAEIAMLQNPGLALDVYHTNGGWYLTSNKNNY
ncbi:MAG: hypothetical protein L0H36_02155 [bacterium]|nr:hypothetical protein [bacterium]MDN5835418.1 hypothetical protein [bacterium]